MTTTETTTKEAAPKASNSPSHIPHSVRTGKDGKSYWTGIGVGFAHKDGNGLNLSLASFPLDGRITVRERVRTEKPETVDEPVEAKPAEASTKPTHIAWHVRTAKDKRTFWTSIGTAFEHKDKKGWNIRLEMIPLDGDIVVRERTQKIEGDVVTPPVE